MERLYCLMPYDDLFAYIYGRYFIICSRSSIICSRYFIMCGNIFFICCTELVICSATPRICGGTVFICSAFEFVCGTNTNILSAADPSKCVCKLERDKVCKCRASLRSQIARRGSSISLTFSLI